MRTGSDAVADWPILNALLNTASGRLVGERPSRRRRRHGTVDPRRAGDRVRRQCGAPISGLQRRAHQRSRHRRHAPRRCRLPGRDRARARDRDAPARGSPRDLVDRPAGPAGEAPRRSGKPAPGQQVVQDGGRPHVVPGAAQHGRGRHPRSDRYAHPALPEGRDRVPRRPRAGAGLGSRAAAPSRRSAAHQRQRPAGDARARRTATRT
mgnify:CR=1 FL=1